jgi:hypothetical protein
MAKPRGKRNIDNPTSPEQSNRDGATPPDTRRSVPGGGNVDRDADAPGVTRKQNPRSPTSSSPGARRPGTTRAGPASMPSGDGVGAPADDALDNESTTASDSAGAPLSVPTGGTGAPSPGAASGASEADAASAGPRAEKGQQREKAVRRRLKSPNAHQDSD